MAESKNIKELLKMMLEARYGKDVRSAIHDSIEQCVDYTEDSLNYVSDFRDEYYPKVIEAVKNSSDNAEKTAADVKQVKTYADKASSSAASASTSASSAALSATAAADSADEAESYAASWKGSLLPQGVVAFGELPTSGLVAGHLYAVKDKFISDSRFEEGAGHPYPQGTCVYWTKDYKWKVLSGVLSLELTKAEYDALTDAQKKNGTIYYVKDADNLIEADEINGLAVVATSGNYNDLKNKPSSLPASDVSGWAKAKTKPSYSADEVGLGNVGNFKAVSTVESQRLTDTEKTNARANIGAQVAGSYASSNHNHDDKYQSKGNYASASHTHTKSQITDFPSSLPANGGNASTVNGHTINADVPSGAKFTDTNTWRGIQNNLTSDSTLDSLSAAQGKVLKRLVDSKVTESQNVATDLNNIKSTGIHHISASTSNNPTGTHGTLFAEFNVGTPYQIWLPDNSNTAYKRNYTTSTSTWGSWTQLKFTDTNTWRPQPDWNATSGDAVIKNKPTIPSVGNGTVTITQNGTTKGTFTMNQGGNTTIALTDNNTTYSAATQSAQGLMSASDKKKLDGITSGANAVIKVMSATDYSKLTDAQKKNGTIYLVN